MGKRLDLLGRKKDGSEFPVEVTLSPFEDHTGFHVIAAVRDVSDRRHVEAELRASERLLRQMVNSLPAAIALLDADQCYRYVNTRYGDWFDLEPNQIVGRTARDVMGEEAYNLARPRIEGVLGGENQHVEMTFPAADGIPRPVEVVHIAQFDDEGAVSGYFVIVLDISDRVNAQAADRDHREALAHFSRVATMGELAASIAHELNQPLAAITANAQAASRFLTQTPPTSRKSTGPWRTSPETQNVPRRSSGRCESSCGRVSVARRSWTSWYWSRKRSKCSSVTPSHETVR